jgi:hypothetical protein
MRHRIHHRFWVGLLGVAFAACSSPPETAQPLATPAAKLASGDVAVGAPVDVTYRFTVAKDAPAFASDFTVFVHFLDTDRELLWDDDHMPATPTRQWKPGQTIEYTRTMFVPKLRHTGATTMEVGLYSPSSGERLPLSGQDTSMRSYRVATFNVNVSADSVFVVFKDGWHDTEVAEGSSGVEWQWSRKRGVLSFRNPKRDATILMQLDQPVALPQPQTVEVRLGDTVLDSFTLPPGQRELRRMSVTADQFGAAETVDLTLNLDQTFIPATLPELKSGDQRDLGVRVFRVFVQPK